MEARAQSTSSAEPLPEFPTPCPRWDRRPRSAQQHRGRGTAAPAGLCPSNTAIGEQGLHPSPAGGPCRSGGPQPPHAASTRRYRGSPHPGPQHRLAPSFAWSRCQNQMQTKAFVCNNCTALNYGFNKIKLNSFYLPFPGRPLAPGARQRLLGGVVRSSIGSHLGERGRSPPGRRGAPGLPRATPPPPRLPGKPRAGFICWVG